MITAKVIKDSVSPDNIRLTTVEVCFNRFILAEVNTHRVFSRNSASSRAVPVEKMIRRILKDPATPVTWGKNQRGMQAEEDLSPELQQQALGIWLEARDSAVGYAQRLMELGVHKQITNRLLEPFMWHTAIITSTQWNNFDRQRDSKLAQPEMGTLAKVIRVVRSGSVPEKLEWNEWHLPYIDVIPGMDIERAKKLSVARCARVSYLTHDGKVDEDADLAMYDKLVSADPPHMSPFEHIATPAGSWDEIDGNFRGWNQLRHLVFPKDYNAEEFYIDKN